MRFRFVRHDSPLSTAVFSFRAGGLTDPAGQEGISHYLEHVLLDASKKYPNEVAVSDAFAKIGAGTNGGTGSNSVCYYGTCLAKRVVDMIDIHCDLVANPLLRDEAVERERAIILSELKDAEDYAMGVFWDELLRSTLRWAPIIGYEASVSAITTEQIRQHYSRLYGLPNLMVTVAGPASAEDEIRDRLKGFGPTAAPPLPPQPPVDLTDESIVRPNFGQACLALVAPGAPGNGADFRENLVAAVASNCVAGPDFSLLFRRVRGELGLTYWIGAQTVRWHGAGITCVASQFDPDLMGQVETEVKGVLQKAVDDGVPEETVSFAKDIMLTSSASTCETSAGLARRFDMYHLAGAPGVPEGYDEYEAMVAGVSPADVDAYVRRAFAPMLDPASSKAFAMTPK